MSKKINSRPDIPEGVACLISPAVGQSSGGVRGGGGGLGDGVHAFFTVNFPFTESRNNCFSQFKPSLRAQYRKF